MFPEAADAPMSSDAPAAAAAAAAAAGLVSQNVKAVIHWPINDEIINGPAAAATAAASQTAPPKAAAGSSGCGSGLNKAQKAAAAYCYQCPQCQEKLGSRPELRSHMRTKHGVPENRFKRIQKVMETKVRVLDKEGSPKGTSSVATTRRGRLGSNNGPAECRSLPTTFVEAMERLFYNCRICFMVFVTLEDVEQHVQAEHAQQLAAAVAAAAVNEDANCSGVGGGDDDDGKTCWHCHKIFANKQNVLRHVIQIHYGHRPFSCKICTMRFFQRRDVIKHIETEHELKADDRNNNNNKEQQLLYENHPTPPNFKQIKPLPKDMYFIG